MTPSAKVRGIQRLVGLLMLGGGSIIGMYSFTQVPPHDETARALSRLTREQQYHSKLYAEYERGGRILDDGADVETIVEHAEDTQHPRDLDQYLESLVCSTDLAVIVNVKSGTSNPTAGGGFLFTDYATSVRRIIRVPLSVKLSVGKELLVTRAGGEATVRGVHITARDRRFPTLLTGADYLLMGKYLTFTSALHTSDPRGTFRIAGERLTRLGSLQEDVESQLAGGMETDVVIPRIERIAARCR